MLLARHQLQIALLTIVQLLAASAHAEAWPRLRGESTEPCLEALAIGQKAYWSNNYSLLVPSGAHPATVRSTQVLGVDEYDISGGDAVVADGSEFEKVPVPADSSPRSIYWQRAAPGAWRIVIGERSLGWRGDMYFLHILPQAVTRAEFLQEWTQPTSRSAQAPLIEGSWRPPAVFRSASGGHWLLHPGEPHDFLSTWSVYTLGATGARRACAIQFRPTVKTAVALLPPEVRHLERLLDRSLGSGENEGTLQPTARLRISVQQIWANVALRPWALGAPYNTRAETDAGLSLWSAASPANRRLHADIRAQTRVAQRALARYYARTFRRSTADAAAAASFAIDVAVREHYVFPSDDAQKHSRDANADPNPWGAPQAR